MTLDDNQPAVLTSGLSFAYNGSLALEEVNLTIRKRDFAWIVGPNGGGKTTLLKLMLGLLKPTSGRVEVLGRDPEAARPLIGYMPQQASLDMQFPVTALDIVLMGRLGGVRRFGPFRSADREAAEHALESVGLADQRGRFLSELSGGQQRRLFVARALAGDPELLLLDEPTANLDPQVQSELYELLHKLNDRLTVVMVSHDPAFVSEFVKQVVCVKRRVHVHPTGEVDSEMFAELYGSGDLRVVRHDRRFHNGETHD